MQLTPEICSRARLARDRRFDGSFYTAVKTTGIFCRPICPARAPLERNVEYFDTAVAAAAAGYRPCLRCRPEAAPDSPAWELVATTVRRALTLMRGQREGFSIEALADRLGITSRYLRKLFAEHLGMSPLDVWQSERALFACALLRDTDLPISQVAFEAGFGSTRRFNAVFQSLYQRTPSDLRRDAKASGQGMRLSLSYRPPMDWPRLLAFFAARALPGVERVEGGRYFRTIRLGGFTGEVCVSHEAETARLIVEIYPAAGSETTAPPLYELTRRLRRLFDLDADLAQVTEVLGRDPKLGQLLKSGAGVRLPGAWDPFEYGLRAILGQQISVTAATTIAGRIVERFGARLEAVGPDATERRLFPTAEALAGVAFDGLGVTRSRAETLRTFVAAVLDGRLDLQTRDLESWCAQATALRGIGDWTAQYIAMRGMSMPDAFPAADLGILLALGENGEKATPAQARRMAEGWRPWRAYGALLLWESLSGGKE